MPVKAIPDGYHSVTPYLICGGATDALAFYAKTFAATERMRLETPDGKIGHAEIDIGDSCVMLADEHPEMGAVGPKTVGGSPVGICLYVEDCDAVFQRAVAAGATVVRPLADQFYGDRSGTIEDPFGHKWTIATHKEDLTPEEIAARMAGMKDK
ncbi:MAG: VOC family protein [Pirellulales bacterium]